MIVFGLALGLLLGAFLRFNIPAEYARYTAVAIVGILDSLFGAIRSSIESKYETSIFLTGLAFNLLVAILLTFLGDKLSLDIYLAILVAFTIRIFANIGVIKTVSLDRYWKRKANKISERIE